jgi:hypothetical protein
VRYSKTYQPSPFGTEEFVQFRQVFGLQRFKLHRHLVYGTVKSVLIAVTGNMNGRDITVFGLGAVLTGSN